MRALTIAEFDGPKSLKLAEVDEPTVGKDEVLVEVHAAGLNRADLLQSLGLYPPPKGYPADRPGLEFMGTVSKTKGTFRRGDRVMGLTVAGAFAERLAVHRKHLLRVPKPLTDNEAAGVPEAFMTGWDAIWLQGGAKPKNRVLIHAVGSGVGTAAVALCRAFGCVSVGTSRTESKLELARPDERIVVSDPPRFADAVRPIDVCLDLVGGSYFSETVEAMASRGTIMVVGLTAGSQVGVSLRTLLAKRLRVIGTTMRARSDTERSSLTAQFSKSVLPLFKSEKLKPVISNVYKMTEARAAFEAMASNQTFGKVILTW